MKVILHCSDSEFGNAVLIDKWHREKNFKNAYGISIGYHFVILNGRLAADKYNHFCNGLIETGRALDDDDKFEWNEVAAATLGHNDCVNICLIGKSGKFSNEQIAALGKVLGWLKEIFKVLEIGQHSDYDPVRKPHCAGFSKEQMDIIRKHFGG